jgi:hypothetical protein
MGTTELNRWSSFTSGPWDWKDDMGLVVGPAGDPTEYPIAEVIGHPTEAMANAQLIACAPELLDVVINMHNYLTKGKDVMLDGFLDQAQSVLSKLGR